MLFFILCGYSDKMSPKVLDIFDRIVGEYYLGKTS
ncbi:MAG: hypothetical protein HNEKOMLI_00648 [Sodalis sp. Psp]|nr:hypothetical protein [Sodalis sp. Psp]MCR3757116.1 hypothetical protein [Sodalis sp. Ppy]